MTKTAHDHLSRKEVKGPDQFQAAATEAVSWATTHRQTLIASVAGAVVVLVAVFGWLAWRESQRQAAGSLLSAALTAAGGEISSTPIPGVPVYATEAERQQAVIAPAQHARQEYGSTRAAAAAALVEGDAQFRLGKLDEALAAYRAYLDAAPKDDSLRFAALDGVARVHEAKGSLDEAVKAWDDAAGVKAYADRAALEKARVLAKAGKTAEAKGVLSSFPETFKDSALVGDAAERLARLGGK